MKKRKATTISLVVAAAAVAVLGPASEAFSLCIYNGELYAKTTLEQEFRDARFVIRGEVLSTEEIHDPNLGVVYHVGVEQTFKGKPAADVVDYSERNSGGFYLDAGTEFLLFLNPIDPSDAVIDLGHSWARRAPDAMMVNYSCGQSRPWSEVPPDDRKLLKALSTETTKTSN